MDTHRTVKAAPPITPLHSPSIMSTLAKAQAKGSSNSLSSAATFKHPRFDISEKHHADSIDIVSPMTVTEVESSRFQWNKSSKPRALTQTQNAHETSSNDQHQSMDVAGSTASSNHTTASTASDIREVAPWIDFDAELSLPSPSNEAPIVRKQIISQAPAAPVKKDHVKSSRPTKRDTHSSVSTVHSRKKSDDFKKGSQDLGVPILKKSDSRKSIFVRSRNPMAKLFDGANDELDDYFCDAVGRTRPPEPRHDSSDESLRVHSPTPVRPFSPKRPFAEKGRDFVSSRSEFDAIPPLNGLVERIDSVAPRHTEGGKKSSLPPSQSSSKGIISPLSFPSSEEDVLVDELFSPTTRSLPFSPMRFMSQAKAATRSSSRTSTHVSKGFKDQDNDESDAASRLSKMV